MEVWKFKRLCVNWADSHKTSTSWRRLTFWVKGGDIQQGCPHWPLLFLKIKKLAQFLVGEARKVEAIWFLRTEATDALNLDSPARRTFSTSDFACRGHSHPKRVLKQTCKWVGMHLKDPRSLQKSPRQPYREFPYWLILPGGPSRRELCSLRFCPLYVCSGESGFLGQAGLYHLTHTVHCLLCSLRAPSKFTHVRFSRFRQIPKLSVTSAGAAWAWPSLSCSLLFIIHVRLRGPLSPHEWKGDTEVS